MAVTLINTFIVPKEQEEEFLRRWKITSAHFQQTDGFIETHLHKNTGAGNATFSFINIAKWQSAAAWKSTHRDYVPGDYSIPGVKGHPSIFECVVDLVNDKKRAEGSQAACTPQGCKFIQN